MIKLTNEEYGRTEYTCPFCGSKMGWDNDFDFEDIYEFEPQNEDEYYIISQFHCANCEADMEITNMPTAYEDENGNKFNCVYWSADEREEWQA